MLTPSANEFKVKMAKEYYEVYPLPSLCELIWQQGSRLFVMVIIPNFKTRGLVLSNKGGMMGMWSCTWAICGWIPFEGGSIVIVWSIFWSCFYFFYFVSSTVLACLGVLFKSILSLGPISN